MTTKMIQTPQIQIEEMMIRFMTGDQETTKCIRKVDGITHKTYGQGSIFFIKDRKNNSAHVVFKAGFMNSNRNQVTEIGRNTADFKSAVADTE